MLLSQIFPAGEFQFHEPRLADIVSRILSATLDDFLQEDSIIPVPFNRVMKIPIAATVEA